MPRAEHEMKAALKDKGAYGLESVIAKFSRRLFMEREINRRNKERNPSTYKGLDSERTNFPGPLSRLHLPISVIDNVVNF